MSIEPIYSPGSEESALLKEIADLAQRVWDDHKLRICNIKIDWKLYQNVDEQTAWTDGVVLTVAGSGSAEGSGV